jgi:hypothetical protein
LPRVSEKINRQDSKSAKDAKRIAIAIMDYGEFAIADSD